MRQIFFLVLLFITTGLFAQAPSNYTNINGRYRWIAGMFDSTFHIPKGTTTSLRTGGSTNAGALFYRTTDSSVYYYTGTQWLKVAGASGFVPYTGATQNVNLGQFGLTTKFVQFDTSSQAVTDRRLQWSNAEGTLQFGMTNGSTITQRIGLEQFARVRNLQGDTIEAGDVVYVSGASGDRASVKLADNRADSTSSKTLGVATEQILPNDVGLVGTFGVVGKLNLSAFTAGDVVYLDSIPGKLTKVKPQAPYHMVFVGVVERANAGNGLLFVNVQNGYELEELHNVRITSPVRNNAILAYDSVGRLWKDTTLNAIGGITGSGTSGQVSYFNGTNSITSSPTFAFTPTSQLLVNNSVTASGAIARGINATPTLTAAANNDVLVGLDIAPTFTNGAFTGVSNLGLRVFGTTSLNAASTGFEILATSNNFFIETAANGTYRVANLINYSGYSPGARTNVTADVFSVGFNGSSSSNGNRFFRINSHGGNSTGAYGASGNNNILAQLNSTTSSYFYISAQGSVGLIEQTANANFKIASTNAANGLELRADRNGVGSSGGGIYYYASQNGTNDGHRWYHNLNEQMRLFFNGNLFIGSTPVDGGFRLDVNGTARVQSFTTINAAPAVNSDAALSVNATTNNSTGGQMYGIRSVSTVATNTGNLTGIDATINNSTTAQNMAGFNSAVNVTANTTAQVRGYSVGSAVTGTGIVTNFIGYDFIDVFKSGSGAITRQIAYRIANLTAGSAANIGILFNNAGASTVNGTWDIYSQSGNASYLAGNLLLGTTSDIGGRLQVAGTITATSAIARGINVNNTLVAAANNDVLVGLDINPTFTNGAFTGVTNLALRTTGNASINGNLSGVAAYITTGAGAASHLLELVSTSSTNGYANFRRGGGANGTTAYQLSNGAASFSYNAGTGETQIYTSAGGGFLTLYSGNTEAMRIFSTTRNILLQNGGTFTDAGFRLDVNGTARVQGATTISTGGADITGGLVLSGGGNFTMRGGAFGSTRTITFQSEAGNNTIGSITATQLGTNRSNIYLYASNLTTGSLFKLTGGSSAAVTAKLTGGQSNNGSLDFFQIQEWNATPETGAILASIGNLGQGRFGQGTNEASAVLQANSTTAGFLPPRMTGAQAEAIATPATGLLVYANNGNGTTITTTGWWGYDGATWVKLN